MKYYIAVTAAAIILSMIGYSAIQYFADQNNIEIHTQVFNEFRELNTKLTPIINEVDNATQLRLDQDEHYQMAKVHFNEVRNITKLLEAYSNGTDRVDRENIDHGLLVDINQTLYKLTVSSPSDDSAEPILNNVTEFLTIKNLSRSS